MCQSRGRSDEGRLMVGMCTREEAVQRWEGGASGEGLRPETLRAGCQGAGGACYLRRMDEDDGFAPPAAEQEELLAGLADLVGRCGAEPLVSSLLLTPSPEFFPDRWGGGELSVRRLLLRLLRYAGLDALAVEVTIYGIEDERAREGQPVGARGGNLSEIWWVNLGGAKARFGVEGSVLADPTAAAAAAARATAQAFRAVHRLTAANAGQEARLVDVTAVFLGFGLLTADASLRYVSRGGRASQTRLGSLSPQAVCFLLAARLAAVERPDPKGLKRLLEGLQANQRAFVRRSLAALARRETPVASSLGLPPAEQWPARRSRAALAGPLAGEGEEEAAQEEEAVEDRGVVGKNAGKPVFRVERRSGGRFARLAVMATMILGGMATRPQMGELLAMSDVMAAGLGLGALAFLIGSLVRERRCSEPKCGASLRPEMTICPRCGGSVMGAIKHPRERLAAEEALREKGAASGEQA